MSLIHPLAMVRSIRNASAHRADSSYVVNGAFELTRSSIDVVAAALKAVALLVPSISAM